MKTVIDSNALPGRLVSTSVVIDVGPLRAGDAIGMARSGMARQLAEEILRQDEFFKTTSYGPGGDIIGIEAEAMVLTREQLRAFGMRCYRSGLESGVLR